jgi:hypothetical protein
LKSGVEEVPLGQKDETLELDVNYNSASFELAPLACPKVFGTAATRPAVSHPSMRTQSPF